MESVVVDSQIPSSIYQRAVVDRSDPYRFRLREMHAQSDLPSLRRKLAFLVISTLKLCRFHLACVLLNCTLGGYSA